MKAFWTGLRGGRAAERNLIPPLPLPAARGRLSVGAWAGHWHNAVAADPENALAFLPSAWPSIPGANGVAILVG
jgi:hypothetical protein